MTSEQPTLKDTRFFFISEAYKKNELQVLSMYGTEGISEPYQWKLELVSQKPNIDFDKVVGEAAKLKIIGALADRWVHGIITRLELNQVIEPQEKGMPQRAIYRAVLAPPMMKLSYRKRLRIFQNRSTEQIVTKVLQDGGVKTQNWNLQDKSKYKAREYCVQYRETDLDFVSRLLEEEGISYHFEHTEEMVTIVFNDNSSGYASIAEESTIIYNQQLSMERSAEFVHSFRYGQQMRIEKVTLGDYNFKKPSAPISGEKTGKNPDYEMYDYPGTYWHGDGVIDSDEAKRLAQMRQEEFQTEKLTGVGASDSNRLIPGHTFTLGGEEANEKHPAGKLNTKYLITRVTHEASQGMVLEGMGEQDEALYGNSVTVIPAVVQYRPARVTHRPVALGNHTATVVGADGQEIYTDEYGRVKVRFHWDRESSGDERSSCWLRISQGWAGSGWGMVYLPRVGQEVLVSFIEGHPDRPIVSGRVYNGSQTHPYGLPDGKTKSTLKSNSSPDGGGFNEIRLEDKKDSEEVYLHAQKDYNVVVENDRTTEVKNDRTETIKHDDTETVNHDQSVTVKNDQSITVNNDQNTIVKGHQNVDVTKDQSISITGNHNLSVTKDSNQDAMSITLSATKSVTIKVGMNSIEISQKGVTINGAMVESTATAINKIQGSIVKIN
jgi:type VI secretion system secreted protein VgrG